MNCVHEKTIKIQIDANAKYLQFQWINTIPKFECFKCVDIFRAFARTKDYLSIYLMYAAVAVAAETNEWRVVKRKENEEKP